MSSDDGIVVSVYQGYFTENCLGLTVMTIIAYEYILTFRQEIDYFWKGKFTGASVLFFLTRYLAVLVNVIETSGFANITQQVKCELAYTQARCTPYVRAGSILSAIQYLPWGAFSAMRVYALSKRGTGLPLSILVLLLSLVPLGWKLGTQQFITGVYDPIVGCEGAATYSVEFAKHTTRLAPASMSGAPSFASTLLQDGLLYFVVLLILNTLHLIFTMLSIVGDSQSPASYLTIFTEPLTAVLIARFLLDLQATNRSALDACESSDDAEAGAAGGFPSPGSLVFERFVGSLASTVTQSDWHAEEAQ
ncbi:hypothetical protein VTO73DRAFT_440 [Trametes versicolor]